MTIMRPLLATLSLTLLLTASVLADDIGQHPGLQLAMAQLKVNQRFTPEFVAGLRPEAEKGDKAAIFALALVHILDRGIPKDEAESARWVEKAWRAGDVDVTYTVGMMYKNGELYPKDAGKSFLWISRAMELGHPDARYFVGFAKEKGLGVAMDVPAAVRLYQEGVDQGHPLSLLRMGNLHREGGVVAKDSQLAFRLWLRGAESGDPFLQATVGMCYLRQPEFFPTAYPEMAKNDVEAYVWLTLAAAGGSKGSGNLRTMAEKRMSASEIKEAMDKVAAFRPKRR